MDATEAQPQGNKSIMKASYKLLSLITDAGLLPDVDLLAVQESSPDEFLGDVLLRENMIRETDLQLLVTTALRVARIPAARIEVPPELAALLPESFCREHRLAPVSRARDFLTIAMVNPLIEGTVEEVEKVTGLQVRRVLCSSDDLDRLIQRAYSEDGGEGMADLAEQDAQDDMSAALSGAAGGFPSEASAPQEKPADSED